MVETVSREGQREARSCHREQLAGRGLQNGETQRWRARTAGYNGGLYCCRRHVCAKCWFFLNIITCPLTNIRKGENSKKFIIRTVMWNWLWLNFPEGCNPWRSNPLSCLAAAEEGEGWKRPQWAVPARTESQAPLAAWKRDLETKGKGSTSACGVEEPAEQSKPNWASVVTSGGCYPGHQIKMGKWEVKAWLYWRCLRKTERVCKRYTMEAGSKSGSSGATLYAREGTGSSAL